MSIIPSMGSIHLAIPEKEEPPALHERAMDNLKYIRETMERATAFTGISGWGQVAIGFTATHLSFDLRLNRKRLKHGWLFGWLEAVIACSSPVGRSTASARAARMPLLSGPGRKVAFSLSPPIFAGAIVTVVALSRRLNQRDPGALLLLYGTARGYRRNVFGKCGSNHGPLFYGAGRSGRFARRICQIG